MSTPKIRTGLTAELHGLPSPDKDYEGRKVEILYAAPRTRHVLPDGQMSVAGKSGDWVVRLIDWQVPAKLDDGATRLFVEYGMIRGRFLRPCEQAED